MNMQRSASVRLTCIRINAAVFTGAIHLDGKRQTVDWRSNLARLSTLKAFISIIGNYPCAMRINTLLAQAVHSFRYHGILITVMRLSP